MKMGFEPEKNFYYYFKRHGIGYAVLICAPSLSEEFFDRLTFSQWKEIAGCAAPDSPIRARALEQLTILADSFSEWLEIAECAAPESPIRRRAVKEVTMRACEPKHMQALKGLFSNRMAA